MTLEQFIQVTLIFFSYEQAPAWFDKFEGIPEAKKSQIDQTEEDDGLEEEV